MVEADARFLEAAQENGELIDAAEELPKSFVLTQEFGAQRVYLTKYNAAVLTRRFETARERAAYPFERNIQNERRSIEK